jgi:hypothetical protein
MRGKSPSQWPPERCYLEPLRGQRATGRSGDCAMACTDLNACLGFVECSATDTCEVDCGPSASCIASATCSAGQVLGDCRSAAALPQYV